MNTLSSLAFADPADDVKVKSVQAAHYENDFLVLTCEASGGKPEYYSFSWSFWSPGLNTWTELSRRNDHYLHNAQLQPEDTGTYECTATNHGGSLRGELSIRVKCE